VSSEGAADAPKDRGPEVINLKMKGMVMPFKHWKHQKEAKSDCRDCHSRKIGKIEGWGEDTAHKVCIPCHDLEEKGPVLCHQCHDKK
jgi:predicted CXXCH cytochrome family protein